MRAAQLDEGLEVLTGLWSGEPFSYEGEHYRIRGTQFLPPPLQQPRIPIWVGSTWPSRRPFRRAARWDGVVPLVADPETDFRASDPGRTAARSWPTSGCIATRAAPVRGGRRRQPVGAGGAAAAEVIGPYEEAGATWWLESIGWPLRPYEFWPEYISAGPPQLA